MTSTTHAQSTRTTSRKDRSMQYIELRLADTRERQLRFQADRDAERAAHGQARSSLRRQVGGSLVRLGRRVAGESVTAPAWQG